MFIHQFSGLIATITLFVCGLALMNGQDPWTYGFITACVSILAVTLFITLKENPEREENEYFTQEFERLTKDSGLM